jgi:serine/threonine protein kinase/tetratricopeptide (TPR) repeat protein
MNEPSLPEETIFAQAMEIDSDAERAAFLDRSCGGNRVLRASVEALLRAHERGGDLLDLPEKPVDTVAEPSVTEHAGSMIGPYKLLEQIGEGGMGLVFVAEQQEPIRRKVALKVIKPGMDTRQVVARFEAERQALALMEHPNIARVLDGGATAGGRPFFVMELVKGVPITEYCDQNQVPIRERLELFLGVCQAVQHAHQKGIIHRDIKPSNVLVVSHDGTPVVKMIDFGVAKAIGQQLTDKTLYTGFAGMVGTPLYMSPEQAGLSGLDVDTRSDIYSLGVLLYELLTGTTPFDNERLQKVGYDELRRIIREEEPPKPSTRISTLAQAATTVSTNRKSDPRRLTQLIRGELDWMVMKCLEKDRTRRYETASALAADVQRYLTDEPVLACPPSVSYRLRKFTRRNRGWLVATGVVGIALVIAVGGIGWAMLDQAARQNKAANDLELALDRAELLQVQGKGLEALAAVDRAEHLAGEAAPDPARNGRLAALKERLAAEARDDKFRARFEEIRLNVQSKVRVEENRFTEDAAFPEILQALSTYRIATGVAEPAQTAAYIHSRPEKVRRELIAALDESLRLAPVEDLQTRQWLLAVLADADKDAWRVAARQQVAGLNWKTLEQLAHTVDVRQHTPSFLLHVARSLPVSMRPTRLELLHRTQRAYPADLWANHSLAVELEENGLAAEAVRYFTAALALRPDSPGIYLNRGNALDSAGERDAAIGDYHQALALAPEYAEAHYALGIALKAKGEVDRAIEEYREAIRIKNDYAEAHCNLGIALTSRQDLDEAVTEFREAIRINKDLAKAHYSLGNVLKVKGRPDEAILEYREAIRSKEDFAEPHCNLGYLLSDKGQIAEAIDEYREAIRIKKDYADAHCNLGVVFFARNQLDDAIVEFRETIHIKKDHVAGHYNLGNALKEKGNLPEAIQEYREALRIKKDYFEARTNLGLAFEALGRLDEAIAEYRAAIQIKKDHAAAHNNLGNVLDAQGRSADAILAYREAIRIEEDYAEAHCNLGHVLQEQGEFQSALVELRRGQELGSRRRGWSPLPAQWLRQCERQVELDGRLPDILKGKTKPASAAECIEFAKVCTLKRLNRAAARFYEEALNAEPSLTLAQRHYAAHAAVLAGCGRGQDAAGLDVKERANLRRRARDWLGADLEVWGRLLDARRDQRDFAAKVAGEMRSWLRNANFAGVREPEALAKLAESERETWQKLWNDVEVTLARAQVRTAPQKKDGK